MSKQLKTIMDKINGGKPINLSTFQKLLNTIRFHHVFMHSDITCRKASDNTNLYYIEHINQDLLAEINQLIGYEDDKNNASTQNLSHAYKVEGSLLLVRNYDSHPQVVLIDKQQNYQTPCPPQNKYAVIIENRQLFIHIHKTLDFLQGCANNLKDSDALKILLQRKNFDVIFGMGNEISNELHHKFLNQYSQLLLLPDMDLGGFLIYQNLVALLGKHKIDLLFPSDLADRLDNVVRAAEHNHLLRLKDIAIKHPQLASLINLITTKRKFIEQESYLC